MRQLLERSQRLIIWLGMLPLAMAVAAYWTSQRHVESVRATLVTSQFLRSLDDLFSTVKDAETGQRGFLLTSQELYLLPFINARKALPKQMQTAFDLGRQSHADETLMSQLPTLIAEKMAELNRTVELQRENPAQALAIVRTNEGYQYMDELRQAIAAIRQQQQRVFDAFDAAQQRRQEVLEAVLAAGVLVSLVLVYMARSLSVRYGHERDQIEHQILDVVSQRTADLEQRTRELEMRTAELQRSNNDLLQFAYVSSHDLQEPLRTIASYVGLLARRLDGQLDDTAKKYVQFAIEGANRMQALINDLLSYSRVGTQGIEISPVPMASVVNTALENLNAAIVNSNAQVRCSPLPQVAADEKKLVLVLQNLIGNAIKFHRPGVPPEIKVDAERSETEWRFAVCDNGIGFDPKYTDRIFQVFQRLHGIGKYPGNGIGLAICRRIIEHHGGRLWATSEPGKGSTFFFTLPVIASVRSPETAVSTEAKRSDT